MIKFNDFVRRITISECVILANSNTREYVALHKDIFLALEEGLQGDCESIEELSTFMIDRLNGKKHPTVEITDQIKNTIYYLVDNQYIDTSETICFDNVFFELSKRFVDINFMEIPVSTDINALHAIVDGETKPYQICNTITCFNLDINEGRIVNALASLGSRLIVCVSDIEDIEYLGKEVDFINTLPIDKYLLIIHPENYDRLINLLKNVDICKDARDKFVMAPVTNWSNMKATKELYAMLYFMGFDVYFCSETLFENYTWPDTANYEKMFTLYSELIDLCDEFDIADMKLNNMLVWPIDKFSGGMKKEIKEEKGIVYYASGNVDRLKMQKCSDLPKCCQECEVQGFCNAPKGMKCDCSVIKKFIIFKLINWNDDLSLKENLNKFIGNREARGI